MKVILQSSLRRNSSQPIWRIQPLLNSCFSIIHYSLDLTSIEIPLICDRITMKPGCYFGYHGNERDEIIRGFRKLTWLPVQAQIVKAECLTVTDMTKALINSAHEGSFKQSVAEVHKYTNKLFHSPWAAKTDSSSVTFKMKEHVWAIIFEHLCCKLNIHILNVDFLVLR